MEKIIRRKAIYLLCCIICITSFVFRANCQRFINLKDDVRNTIADSLIQSANRWEGVFELTGNNDHSMITIAMNLCKLSGDKGYPWCAACQAEIHNHANVHSPHSARVVDWFNTPNNVWKKGQGDIPEFINKKGMVGGLYYHKLKRLGHIFLIVGEDKNNFYTLEGNTNIAGSRDGDGFYKKIRSKNSVYALADYCICPKCFSEIYNLK